MAATVDKQRIYETLKRTYFDSVDDLVDVSDGPVDAIHLVLVSHKFDGMGLRQKNDLVCDLLEAERPDELTQKFSLTICKTPEEIKSGV